MMKKNFPNYFMTSDCKKIFYNTNFDPQNSTFDSRPLLVFNYGLVCNIGHWSKQIPFFDQAGYKILVHNYRGHFNSSGQDDLASCHISNFVQDIKKLLKFLHCPKAIMLGHSMGVNITLEFAKENPEIIKGIVLISGTVLPPQETMFDSHIMAWVFPVVKTMSEKYPKFFQTLWETTPLVPLIQKFILHGGFNPEKVSLEFIQQYMNRIRQLPPELFFQLFEGMGKHSIKSHLQKIHSPALIIGGEKDKIVPNHFQEMLQKNLPYSEFYLVKDGSHVPQVDFPHQINERILTFVEKQI